MNTVMTHALNWVDYAIIVIVLFSTLISLMRGFISEAISLLTWIIAAVAAFKGAGVVGNFLSGIIHTPSIRLIVAFIIIFIAILILGSLINHFLGVFIHTTGLSGTNRILGMIFGFARGVLLVAILLLFAKYTSVVREPWWKASQLIPHFIGLTNWLQQFIPVHLGNVTNYFSQTKAGYK